MKHLNGMWLGIVVLMFFGVAMIYAAGPTFDRIAIMEQAASGNGSNGSIIGFVPYGADYMNDNSSFFETGNYLAGQYHDTLFGYFTLDWSPFLSDNVHIGGQVSNCATGTGYKLAGNAYSELFGFVDFSYNNDIYVYYCVNDNSLYGYAYGEGVGFQNFTGIKLTSGIPLDSGGLKILGQGHNQKFIEIEAGQNERDLHIIGKIDKSLQLGAIKKRVFGVSRTLPEADAGTKNIGNLSDFNMISNKGGVVFQNGNIIYYRGNAGDFVTLGSGSAGGTLSVQGKKTIIIEGADLYIKSNITYGNKDRDILGVIVLQDRDGHGGNIVVHPSVTNLAGALVAEKVLSSGFELGGVLQIHDGSTDEAVLANQLHIMGNLFSENTIGGSVATPLKCPYYINQVDCQTVSQAQSYDLNFLRRFKLDIYGDPAHGGMIAGGGTCNAGVCSGGDPNLMRNIESTRDALASYPLIIEYNPNIQLMPPPFLKSQ